MRTPTIVKEALSTKTMFSAWRKNFALADDLFFKRGLKAKKLYRKYDRRATNALANAFASKNKAIMVSPSQSFPIAQARGRMMSDAIAAEFGHHKKLNPLKSSFSRMARSERKTDPLAVKHVIKELKHGLY